MQRLDFTKVQGYGHLFPCKPVVFPDFYKANKGLSRISALGAIAVFNISVLKAAWERASLSEYPMLISLPRG